MMNSHCISKCIADVHTPIRPTYRNLYKWPESDAEFMRSVSESSSSSGHQSRYPRVVESMSCRQMYLRSYTFSTRKETMQEKITRKCFPRSMDGVAAANKKKKMRSDSGEVFGKAKEMSCGAWLRVFRRMLACGVSVHCH